VSFRNIVVGVSNAPTSQAAGRQAFELAELTGATVHVVTAIEASEDEVVEIGSDRFVLSDRDAAQSSIEAFVRSLGSSAPSRVVVVDSKPGDALVEVAEQVDADLIVVGNVRMQGFGRLLGSVGNDVSHHAPCSVLIVKTV